MNKGFKRSLEDFNFALEAFDFRFRRCLFFGVGESEDDDFETASLFLRVAFFFAPVLLLEPLLEARLRRFLLGLSSSLTNILASREKILHCLDNIINM